MTALALPRLLTRRRRRLGPDARRWLRLLVAWSCVMVVLFVITLPIAPLRGQELFIAPPLCAAPLVVAYCLARFREARDAGR